VRIYPMRLRRVHLGRLGAGKNATPDSLLRTVRNDKTFVRFRPQVGVFDMCARCREIERDLRYLSRLHADTKDHFAVALLGDTIKDLQSEIDALHPNNDRALKD
jgi:hypothetical protein